LHPGFRTDPIVYLSVLRYCHFAVILSTLICHLPIYLVQQNISAALEAGSKAIHPDVNVTATDFDSSALLFSGLGIPFSDFVNDMNKLASHGEQLNDSTVTIVPTGQLFEEMYLYSNILDVSTIW
jgi:hypothetical protein